MAPPRRDSLLFLGALTVLAVGAIALSLATAPPAAEQQLRVGAGATTGVGSFVMDLTNTVTTKGVGRNQVQQSTVHFVYQSPDRLDETLINSAGQKVELLVVGNERFERTNGRWVQLPAGANGPVSTGEAAVNDVVLVPATAATFGTPVVRYGQTSSSRYSYDLDPQALATVYRVLFGVNGNVISSHHFGATIDKEYMVAQSFVASAGNQTDAITIRYSQLGTAPAVEPPPPSALRVSG